MNVTLPEFTLELADEVALARRVEAGVFAAWLLEQGSCHDTLAMVVRDGEAARDELFTANLRLVARIARDWALRFGLDVEELFQEGCTGLGEAIMRYDHARGHRFSTLAWQWVSNRVAAAALTRCGEVEAPVWRLRARRIVRAVEAEMTVDLRRPPTTAELAERLGKSVEWVEHTLEVGGRAQLFDAAADQPHDGDEPDWRAALQQLPDIEREVVIARVGLLGDPAARADVAAQLGLSDSTVGRIETRALRRMRRQLVAAAERSW